MNLLSKVAALQRKATKQGTRYITICFDFFYQALGQKAQRFYDKINERIGKKYLVCCIFSWRVSLTKMSYEALNV